MRAIALLLLICPAPAFAGAAALPQTRLGFDIYAAGLRVAALEASYGVGAGGYSIALAFHTTGLAGALFSGRQSSVAQGVWRGEGLEPLRAAGDGYWRGEPHRLAMEYRDGDPVVRELSPPNGDEREPVPPAMQAHTMDTLSALMLLVRKVDESGRCDVTATTFDGRRLVRVTAHTAGQEVLTATDRSDYAGPAMRCDFDGVLLAGALKQDDPAAARRPKHGSAWFAPAVPGQPPTPVRMTFETRWFGDATMYLTSAAVR